MGIRRDVDGRRKENSEGGEGWGEDAALTRGQACYSLS